jgi:cadmium resistance protein CadD (predicted permease)
LLGIVPILIGLKKLLDLYRKHEETEESFVVMTALWCFLAHAMVNHPKWGSPIRRYGHRLAPVVLIGLGVLILCQTGSFGLLLR